MTTAEIKEREEKPTKFVNGDLYYYHSSVCMVIGNSSSDLVSFVILSLSGSSWPHRIGDVVSLHYGYAIERLKPFNKTLVLNP